MKISIVYYQAGYAGGTGCCEHGIKERSPLIGTGGKGKAQKGGANEDDDEKAQNNDLRVGKLFMNGCQFQFDSPLAVIHIF